MAYTSSVLSLDDIATVNVELDQRSHDLKQVAARLKSEFHPATLSEEDIDRILKVATKLRETVSFADNDPLTQRRILEQ